MKLTLMKAVAVIAAVMMATAGLTACSLPGANDADVAVDFAGEKISVEEAKLYIYATQFEAEVANEYYVAYAFQTFDNFWAYADKDGHTYADHEKEEALNRLIQVKTLVKEAGKSGISLSADEEAKVQTAIADFKTDEAAVLAKAGVSDAVLENFIRENAIANKMYLSMISGVDTSMDDAENQRKRLEGVNIAVKSSYTEEGADEATEYTDEEKADNLAAAFDQVQEMMGTMSPAEIAEAFEGDKTVTVSSLGEFSAKPSDAQTGPRAENYLQLAWGLSTDEVGASIISETNAYVLRCLNDDDAEYRKAAEDSIMAERKSALFTEEYEKLTSKYTKYHIFADTLTDVKIEGHLYESEILSIFNGTATEETEAAEE